MLPATVRYISALCPLQRHWPMPTRAGCFLQLKHLKTLVPTLHTPTPHQFLYLQSSTLHVLSLYKYLGELFLQKTILYAPLVDAFGLSHKPLSYLLASPGLVIHTSQVQTLIKLEVQSSQA